MAADFGIYGTTYPALITTGSVTIALENADVIKDEPEWVYGVRQSIRTGHRKVTRVGAHWIVEIIYNLYKTGTLAQQKTKAETLQNLKWNGTEFYYYKHADGDAYRDASNNGVTFRLVEFKPFPREDVRYEDAVYLKMISTSCVKVKPTRTY
jgi:hypothetical protein